MAKYIDVDELKKQDFRDFSCTDVWYAIDNCPTADVKPIVRGEWIMDVDPDDGDCRCSHCRLCIDALHRDRQKTLEGLGYDTPERYYPFCPRCGADMREKS